MLFAVRGDALQSDPTRRSFSYIAVSALLMSMISIPVAPVQALDDDEPTGSPDSYEVQHGGLLATDVATSVLANDEDHGNGPLSAVLIDPPSRHEGAFDLQPDGTFTYEHDGSAPPTDTFTYRADNGEDMSDETTVQINIVANAVPVVDAGPDIGPVAVGTPVVVDAAFVDAGLGATHTATIEWGDGTVHNCPGDCDVTFDDQSGDGTVMGTHPYAAAGNYTVTVTVDDGASSGADTLNVAVIEPDIAVDPGPDQEGDEGDTIAVAATFANPDGAGVHTATIDWGDGTIEACPGDCIVNDAGDGTGTVDGSHEYADDGVYSVIVTVRDDGGDSGSGELTTDIANVAPTAGINGPGGADEGDTVDLIGIRSDPGAADTFTFDWQVTRDGAPYATAATKNLSLLVDDDGEYVFTFTATDDDGATSAPATHTLTVANVDPAVQITDTDSNPLPPSSNGGDEGVLLRLRNTVTDPGDEEFTYQWRIRLLGKIVGSSTNRNFNFATTDSGTYFVALTVDDGDGGSSTDSVLITIDNVAPTIDAIDFDATPRRNVAVPMEISFSDVAADDTLTVTVDWGAGPPSSSSAPSPVTLSHTYAASATKTVRVCVADDDGGEDCRSFFVNPGARFEVSSDFDGDGNEDLPIGVPGEDGAGGVAVLYGGPGGVSAAGDQILKQGVAGINGAREGGDGFGRALAWSDFDLDGFDDLAVAATGEDVGGEGDVGIVHVIYGSASGLTGDRDATFHQESAGIPGSNQPGDAFGSALAAGDFNGDGFGDLAIGVPFEDLAGEADTGRVVVMYGSPTGLRAAKSETWDQNKPGVKGVNINGDHLGTALAAGDFDLDGAWELAMGMPGKNVGGERDAGAFLVLGGSLFGLDASNDQKWDQDTGSIVNSAQEGDRFGSVLTTGDFNGDSRPDLAIGIPREDINGRNDAGAVAVMLSNTNGLSASADSIWHEATPNVKGAIKARDQFGYSVAAGDFNRDGRDDLAIGIPYQETAGKANAGAVHVLYGGPNGIKAAGDQRWTEANKNVLGAARKFDHFGWAVRAFDQDGDGDADLAVGVPDDNIARAANAGAVLVLKGRSGPMVAAGNSRWHQNTNGIVESVGAADRMGWAL